MVDLICAECGHGNDDSVGVCAKCGAPLSAEGRAYSALPLDKSSGDWVGLVEAGDTKEARDTGETVGKAPLMVTPSAPSPAPLNPAQEYHGDIAGAPLDSAESEMTAQEGAAQFAVQDPPHTRRRLWPLLLVSALVAALIGGYFGWTLFGAGPQMAEVADAPEAAAPSDNRPAWQASYTDSFLSPDTQIMVVAAEAKQRDFPSTDGTVVARERREGEMVSGRFVRGADGSSRWLKLSDGGYIWDGNLAVAGGPGSPIAISFSNRDTSFGPEIGRYLDQASAIIERRYARADSLPPKEQAAYLESIETDATFAPVPNRRFHGLTVVAVGQYYEGSGIIFREREGQVIAALRGAGVVIHDDGSIPLVRDQAESCSVGVFAPKAGEPQDGASQLTCGL